MSSFIVNKLKKICMIIALCFPLQLCANDDEKIESLKQKFLNHIKVIDQTDSEIQKEIEIENFLCFLLDKKNEKHPFFNVTISKNYPIPIELFNDFSQEKLKKLFNTINQDHESYSYFFNKFLYFKFLYDPNTEIELLKKIIDKMTYGSSYEFISLEEGLEFFENIRKIYLKHNELYEKCLNLLNRLLYSANVMLKTQLFSKIEQNLVEDTKIMPQDSVTFDQLKNIFLLCNQTLTEPMRDYFIGQKDLFIEYLSYKNNEFQIYGEEFEELKFTLYNEALLDEDSSFSTFQKTLNYFLSALPNFSSEKQSIVFNNALKVFNDSSDVVRRILSIDILMNFNIPLNSITQIKNKTYSISQLLLNNETYLEETKLVCINTLTEIIKKYGLPNELDDFLEHIRISTLPTIKMFSLYNILCRTKINDIEKLQKLLNEVLSTHLIDINNDFIKRKIYFLYTYYPYASIHEKTKIINASHELLKKYKKLIHNIEVEYQPKDEWSCKYIYNVQSFTEYSFDGQNLDFSFNLNKEFPSCVEFSHPYARRTSKYISFDFSKMTGVERIEFLEIFVGLASIDDVDPNFMSSVIVLLWGYLKDFYKDDLDLNTNDAFKYDVENYLCPLIHAIFKNSDFFCKYPTYLDKLIDLYTHFEFDHSKMNVETMLNNLQKICFSRKYHLVNELGLFLKIVKMIEDKETYKNLIIKKSEELCKNRKINGLDYSILFKLSEHFHKIGFKEEATSFLSNIWDQIDLERLKQDIEWIDLNSLPFLREFLKEKGIKRF
ncbi:MAG: hypothetical protein Q8L85_01695 [Alphaproteobacteria bacterium]|nr:hypothetical protein [Alphaproteobacteria bacterium]